jgi:hypothetical protein
VRRGHERRGRGGPGGGTRCARGAGRAAGDAERHRRRRHGRSACALRSWRSPAGGCRSRPPPRPAALACAVHGRLGAASTSPARATPRLTAALALATGPPPGPCCAAARASRRRLGRAGALSKERRRHAAAELMAIARAQRAGVELRRGPWPPGCPAPCRLALDREHGAVRPCGAAAVSKVGRVARAFARSSWAGSEARATRPASLMRGEGSSARHGACWSRRDREHAPRVRQAKPGGGGSVESHQGRQRARKPPEVNPAGQSCPAKAGHQPEASLAWARGDPHCEA